MNIRIVSLLLLSAVFLPAAAKASSLVVEPDLPSMSASSMEAMSNPLPEGEFHFRATYYADDGSSQDVTGSALWVS